jgi:hypothetical protein
MLHMLQVFQRHAANICSKYFICFQTSVTIIFLSGCSYVSHICCNSMFQCFSCFSLMLSKLFHIASCKSGCFMCFTHMLQMRVLNVSSTFKRMLRLNVFHVASVLCCTAGGERTRRVVRGGPADGGAASARAGGMLVLNCSS